MTPSRTRPLPSLDEIRQDWDWQETFRYAEGGNAQGESPDIRRAAPLDEVDLSPFGLADVAVIFAATSGEPDEADWICWGQLRDGRFFSIRAGCDYTGWDCQAGGHAEVASSRALILAHGFDQDEQERLGLTSEAQ